MKQDLDTITLSGTLATDVQTSRREDLQVARFLVDVAGAGEGQGTGTFKVVAFGDRAEEARDNLKEGDSVILLGALKQRRASRNGHNIEIHAKTLIRMSPRLLEHAARD